MVARWRWVAVWGCLVAASAHAGHTVDLVKSRGELRCGVSEGIAGFSARDPAGHWHGMDADFCRAVAAALLGDAGKVVFVPLRASARFPALRAGSIDVLARNTSWTLTREALLGMQFPAVLFYDGQAFMVPRSASITAATGLDGATVCVEKGTTHQRNLEDYARARGIAVRALVIDSALGVAQAFFAGRCQAYSSDASQLAAARMQAPDAGQAYVILPQRISKEALAPVVSGGDAQWATLVRWVLYALIQAEENGVTRAAAEAGTDPLRGQRSDLRDAMAAALGVEPGWALRALQAVGNYGEMFERNLGSGSPLRMERGLNRLWTEGGLMYAPSAD